VAAARANGQKGGRPRKRIGTIDIGTPPEDPLQLAGWALTMLSKIQYRMATTPNMSDKERKHLESLVRTLKVAGALVPRERLARAERLIREDHEQLETTVDPKLEDDDDDDPPTN
jgi:hypothetical protein